MKKKDTLYTVTPWNKRMVAPRENLDAQKNLFDGGGFFDDVKNAFNKDNWKGTVGNIATSVAGKVGYGLISNGYSSGAGETMNVLGDTVSQIPGLEKVGAAFNLAGGVYNRLAGTKVNQAALRAANEGTAALNNFRSNAGSFDEIQGPQAFASVQDVYKGGWFSGSKARRKNAELKRRRAEALDWANRSVENNIDNIASDQMNNALANYAAEGGFMDFTGGMDVDSAIGYGFMNDYLLNKKAQNESKNKVGGLGFLGGEPQGAGTLLALGGDVQTHGGDFTTGMTRVDAGGSHEGNPNDGVQMGVDSEGVPNLVEEGEVVFNDFVYSRRIMVNDEVKKRFHLPKKKEMSYADVAKKLEKEFAERPNDPISKAAFKKQMEELAQMQEEQKKEMEVERARQAFEALSDEEKMALIQQQEAQEQAALQQQAMAEQQMAQAGGLEAEPQGTVMSEGAMMQEGQPVMAEGGNLYATAGPLKNAGTWKEGDSASNWNAFTRKGLEDYLNGIIERINAAESDEEKNAIRQEAIDAVGGIQQAYRKAYQNSLTPSEWNADVEALQQAFQAQNGNAYFGNIADAINLPVGANTADREGTWVDGYWGPRTSIRNWGSTEYGDAGYYKTIADLANKAGLTYAPNDEWTYGENGANRLYGLSLLNSPEVTPEDAGTRMAPAGDGIYHDPAFAPGGANGPKPADTGEGTVVKTGEEDFVPKHRWEDLRYAGLFGPALGLGLNLAGVGRPKFAGLDAAFSIASNPPVLANWKPIGNYVPYKPFDVWSQRNRNAANMNSAIRAITNTSNPNKNAGVVGALHNALNADGELGLAADKYNYANLLQAEGFNRDTDKYNSQAYQQNSQFNADALNRNRQYAANLAMNAEAQKMAADAGWYNSIYGNIGGLAKGLGDLGRENKEYNMFVDLLSSGAIPGVRPEMLERLGYGKAKKGSATYKIVGKDGGKINRRKGRKGLTF